ncbi:hypothetical protein FOL47_003968, partial [Perkinsus chesapeaki]
ADANLDDILPDWALEGAVRRSSRIREAREGSVVSDRSGGGGDDFLERRSKKGRPKRDLDGGKTPSSKKKKKGGQQKSAAARGSSRSTSTSRKDSTRRRPTTKADRFLVRPSGSGKININTVAPLNGDIGFLRMEMSPKAGWSRSGIWRRGITLEKLPLFPPLPLHSH